MKPRLPAAPWTEEDNAIEWRNTLRHGRKGQFGFMGTQPADRCDADMMYEAQTIAKYGPSAITLWGIEVRGWTTEPL